MDRGLYVERRAHRREDADLEVIVGVEIYGFKEDTKPFFASGLTSNVGPGGMLARLDAPLASGAICKIFFRDEGEVVRPRHVRGRVLRCDEVEDGFVIAVAFEQELLRLSDTEPDVGLAATA